MTFDTHGRTMMGLTTAAAMGLRPGLMPDTSAKLGYNRPDWNPIWASSWCRCWS
jgi:hypothetical protein